MAIGDSIIGICCSALTVLGEDPIASLTPATTKRQILCAQEYDGARRTMLRRHPWSCARAGAQLAALPTPPPFGRANAYQLPADFLRFWDVDQDEDDNTGWDVVGTQLHADDAPPLNIWYVCDLQDTVAMDALLVRCIALELAMRLALPLTQSQSKKQAVAKELADLLPEARLVTSQENSSDAWREDVWLRSRNT